MSLKSLNKKKIVIDVPEDLLEHFNKQNILDLMYEKALSKTEYYKSKSKYYENKYKKDFLEFQEKYKNRNDEDIEEWDDYIVWESYITAFNEWEKKTEELKACLG